METRTTSFGEKFMNNIWLIFALGVAIFFVSYIIWGIYQIGQVPEMPASVKQEVLN